MPEALAAVLEPERTTVAASARPAQRLPLLFQPLRLQQLELPNRVLMSSMHLNLDDCEDAYGRMAAFYTLRAAGEVGLIITAGCAPNVAGRATPNGFSLDSDSLLSEHRRITDAVHAVGGRIALQILHFGREAFHGGLVSASSARLVSNLFTPRALLDAEIEATIGDFADCAQRAVSAGYDAIEVVFSQGFLIHQFLVPACNQRDDQWGGSFDHRSRLAVRVAEAVRARVGPIFPLIFRVPCLDLLQGGLSTEESRQLIRNLTPYGIDLLNVSIGWHESDTPTIAMSVPRAAFAGVAAGLRKEFPQLKVAVSNRINDPCTAEQLLQDGVADVIAMARPFLADPQWVTKARQGKLDAINTCIACNQSCLDYVFTGEPVGCSVNPDCNLPGEGQYPVLKHSWRVAVVGGGIAGMGAALFLARRGARVVLFETAMALGGQLQLAARVPGKQEFAETVRYYAHAMREAGVEVRLGLAFMPQADDGWDHVVLAQGSQPRALAAVPGIDADHVLDYLDVLQRDLPVKFPVVIIGGGGVACDVAKYLLDRRPQLHAAGQAYLQEHGCIVPPPNAQEQAGSITLLQRSSRKFAHRLGRTTRWIVMQSLQGMGVAFRNQIELRAIEPGQVRVLDRRTGQEQTIAAQTVVLAAGQEPVAAPVAELARLGIPFTHLGAARPMDAGSDNVNLTSALQGAYRLAMSFS